MLDLAPNSLEELQLNPLFQKVDFGRVKIADFGEAMRNFRTNNGGVKLKNHGDAETDILNFYFFNQVLHFLNTTYQGQVDLPGPLFKIAKLAMEKGNIIGQRVLFYTMHAALEQVQCMPQQDDKYYGFFASNFHPSFNKSLRNKFSGSLMNFDRGLSMSLNDFTRALMLVFSFGNWPNGWGKKVGNPSSTLVNDFASGKISLGQMTDQAFSLSHHVGSIFHRGLGWYNRCNDNNVFHLLDIQGSSQIPQWLKSNLGKDYVSQDLRQAYHTMVSCFPDFGVGKVDQKAIKDCHNNREKAQQNQAIHLNFNLNGNQGAQPKPQVVPANCAMDHILVDMYKKGKLGI